MAVKPYVSNPTTLGASAAVVGAAVPALTTRIIKAATLTNTTAVPIQATVYFVPDAGAPGPGNTFISELPIAAHESYPCPELINQGLNVGGTVWALGSGLTFGYSATDFI